MKYLITFFIFLMGISATAQPPQLLKYQGIARDSTGNPVSNDTIALRISIHQGTPAGTVVYKETHFPITNQFGSFSINIGGGTVNMGNFSTIPWSRYNYFQEVEMDVTGGNSFVSMGTSQYLSVPYALNGASSGFRAHISTSIPVAANSSVNVLFDVIDYNDGNNFAAGVFTAPTNGFYHFDALVLWNYPAYQDTIYSTPSPYSIRSWGLNALLYVNSTLVDAASIRTLPTGFSQNETVKISTNIYLTAGQVVSVTASNGSISYQSTVSNQFNATYISGYKIY